MGSLLGDHFKKYDQEVEIINQSGKYDYFQFYDELAVEHKIRQLTGARIEKDRIFWTKWSQSYFVFVKK